MKASKQIQIETDCSVITMRQFIECFVNHNYTVLVKSGKPTSEELLKAWDKVWIEYCEASGQSRYKYVVSLLESISVNEWRLVLVDMCLFILVRQYSKECIDILREKLGYNYAFDYTDKNAFAYDLKKVRSASKSVLITLQMDKQNLEKVRDQNAGKKTTKKDFDKIFFQLNSILKHGYKVTPDNTTVNEYCTMLNSIKEKPNGYRK